MLGSIFIVIGNVTIIVVVIVFIIGIEIVIRIVIVVMVIAIIMRIAITVMVITAMHHCLACNQSPDCKLSAGEAVPAMSITTSSKD